MSELHRKNTYQNKTIFIDGMWRCGKSLLTPLVGALDNVDKVKFDYHSEWVSVLHFLGKVDLNTTKILLNMYSDLTTYNNFLGREINIRPKDDSGIFKNPKSLNYLLRIFKDDTSDISKEIEIKKPIQLINTHNVFQISEPLVESFNERLLFLRCVRNPVYNILDWAEYFEKVGEDPREMNFYLGKKQIPWFVSHDNQDLFVIPFEKLTKDPNFFMSEICKRLDIANDKSYQKLYKKLKLPRPSNSIDEYKALKDKIIQKIENHSIKNNLENLISIYESKYS